MVSYSSTLEKPVTSNSFPEDGGTNLLQIIGKSLQDHKPSRTK